MELALGCDLVVIGETLVRNCRLTLTVGASALPTVTSEGVKKRA